MKIQVVGSFFLIACLLTACEDSERISPKMCRPFNTYISLQRLKILFPQHPPLSPVECGSLLWITQKF